jgi:hypothetical protein
MASCARAVQQADGSFLLALDPSQTDPAVCAYVIESGQESVLGSLGTMTTDDALVISGAVALLWALAWGLRQVAHSLFSFSTSKEFHNE